MGDFVMCKIIFMIVLGMGNWEYLFIEFKLIFDFCMFLYFSFFI